MRRDEIQVLVVALALGALSLGAFVKNYRLFDQVKAGPEMLLGYEQEMEAWAQRQTQLRELLETSDLGP